MTLMMQGWKTRPDGTPVVAAIVLSKAQTWEAWEFYRGEYDPAKGQTINDAVWEFHCAGHLMSIVNINLIGEILSWQDQQQGTDLLAALRAIKDSARAVCASIEASVGTPAVYRSL